jgi:hypothetical protein
MSNGQELTISPSGLPRVHFIENHVLSKEPINITALSDLHLENTLCDVNGLVSLLKERSQLSNHSVIMLGDVLDLIGHEDQKRHRPSMHHREMADRDAWVNDTLSYAIKVLKIPGVKYDLISPGNHEDEFLKRHGLDLTSILCKELGAARGGYSGVVDYRVHVIRKPGVIEDKKYPSTRVRVIYHHGAWGGKYAKGYLGAHPWAAQWDDWQIMLYGHCHSSRLDCELRQRVKNERIETYPTYMVNCSSWVDTYSDKAEVTHYSERFGYIRQPNKAPLITMSADVVGHYNTMKVGYTVTI